MGYVEPKLFQKKNGEIFNVRTALPEDAERLLSFNKTIIREAPYLLTTEEEFKLTYDQQNNFLRQMEDGIGKLAIIAEYQGEFGMSVANKHRNQGIGKALLTVLLDWAKDTPLIEKVCLEVFAANTNAIYLYKKLGFIEEGRKSKAIKFDSESYHDLISMAFFIKN